MYEIIYINGDPYITKGALSIPAVRGNSDFEDFLLWNAKQETPLDYKTPIEIEKPKPEPTIREELLAMRIVINGMTDPGEPATVEEVDLLVKTGWLTEEQGTVAKAEEK